MNVVKAILADATETRVNTRTNEINILINCHKLLVSLVNHNISQFSDIDQYLVKGSCVLPESKVRLLTVYDVKDALEYDSFLKLIKKDLVSYDNKKCYEILRNTARLNGDCSYIIIAIQFDSINTLNHLKLKYTF